jgi:hypothetical protein
MQPAEPMTPATARPLTSAWREWGRWLAAIGAIAFAVTAVILLLDNLHVFFTPPDLPETTPFPDRLIAILQYESQHFPIALLNALTAIVSFSALAALGPVLRRMLDGDDPRGSLVLGAFAVGGLIGVIGQLEYAGALAVASNASYCQCEFADPQVIARGEVLDLVNSIQGWSIAGTLVAFAVGLLLVGSLGRRSLAIPTGWLRLSTWLGVLMIVVAVATLAFPPLANALRWDVDPDVVTGIPSLLILLVLVPWWALWLRSLLRGEASTA